MEGCGQVEEASQIPADANVAEEVDQLLSNELDHLVVSIDKGAIARSRTSSKFQARVA
jgi:hypothetical protein